MISLKPCPLCGDTPEIVGDDDFHMSFVTYDKKDATVEFNFLHYGAIHCGCGLTLPFFGGEVNKNENIDFWNGKRFEQPDS